MSVVNLFTAKRTQLLSDPKYQSIADAFGKSFNEHTRDALTPISQQRPPYDPYQIEQFLADISTLIDRCLVYQRQYIDLDTLATKTMFDDKLFLDQADSLKSIELAESIEEQRRAERTQQAIAAGKFWTSSGDRWLALAEVAGNDEAIKGEMDRKKAVRLKWDYLQTYMAEFRERYKAPGNSFNWEERADRILTFYRADIREAYQKARATQKALDSICGLSTSLPELKSSDILKDLVVWNREAITQFEIFREADIEFEMTVFIRQPTADGSRLKSDAEFEEVMRGAGEITLDLSDYFPASPAAQFLRVRGVGMSMSMSGNLSADLHRLKLYRLSAIVFPPSVREFFPSTVSASTALPSPTWVPRSPSIVSNVSITDPSTPVRYVTGVNINNVDPRGIWKIKVSRNLGYPDTERRQLSPEVTDIKLHLLLAGQLSADLARWSNAGF
jgi:hypothetical protein